MNVQQRRKVDSWIGTWNNIELAAEVVMEVETKAEFPAQALLFNYLTRNKP